MANLQSVRGTQDFIGSDAAAMRWVTDKSFQVSQRFGFEEISTPVFEFTEVFKRSIGEATDIISKEMYTFNDRGGDELTLRPEGTAGIARAFLSNGLTREIPLKWFYAGPMFRYERPQKGRYRQFHQMGVEVLGLAGAWADVETISLGAMILKELGLSDSITLELNTLGDKESRDRYRTSLVEYFSQYESELSEDSQNRLKINPLRILDSKSEADQKFILEAPKLINSLNDESKQFFDEVLEGLNQLKIEYKLNDQLVRGLDYYCHTVFEFTTDQLGSQNAVLSGGRYDQLVETMGGPATAGVGWAAGLERMTMLIDRENQIKSIRPVTIVPVGKKAESLALKTAQDLRAQKVVTVQIASGKNLGKLMKKANKTNAQAAIIIGDNEIENGKAVIKDFDQGEQCEVSFDQLCDYVFKNFATSIAE